MYKYRGHAHAHHTRSSRRAGQDPKEDLKNWPKGRIAWTNRLRMSFGLGPIVVMPMSMLPPVLPAVLPPVTAILPGELHQARVLTGADLDSMKALGASQAPSSQEDATASSSQRHQIMTRVNKMSLKPCAQRLLVDLPMSPRATEAKKDSTLPTPNWFTSMLCLSFERHLFHTCYETKIIDFPAKSIQNGRPAAPPGFCGTSPGPWDHPWVERPSCRSPAAYPSSPHDGPAVCPTKL